MATGTKSSLPAETVSRAMAPAEHTPPLVVGLFADDPELLDDVCEEALRARERDPLRLTDA